MDVQFSWARGGYVMRRHSKAKQARERLARREIARIDRVARAIDGKSRMIFRGIVERGRSNRRSRTMRGTESDFARRRSVAFPSTLSGGAKIKDPMFRENSPRPRACTARVAFLSRYFETLLSTFVYGTKGSLGSVTSRKTGGMNVRRERSALPGINESDGPVITSRRFRRDGR